MSFFISFPLPSKSIALSSPSKPLFSPSLSLHYSPLITIHASAMCTFIIIKAHQCKKFPCVYHSRFVHALVVTHSQELGRFVHRILSFTVHTCDGHNMLISLFIVFYHSLSVHVTVIIHSHRLPPEWPISYNTGKISLPDITCSRVHKVTFSHSDQREM